jgi:hypothetical protein
MDGESTERNWAAAVVAALQMAEMNPAAWHAALNDHWIDRNFTRMIGLSELLTHATQHLLMDRLEDLLLKWFNEAAKWAPLQRATVTRLETGYPITTINAWKALVAKWEEDHQSADPYEEPEFGESTEWKLHVGMLIYARGYISSSIRQLCGRGCAQSSSSRTRRS